MAVATTHIKGYKMQKLKLLIAEDTKTMRKLYEVGISEEDFTVTFAEDGQQAIDEYKKSRYDIVLLDIQLPLLSGFTVLKMIREIEPVVKKNDENNDERRPLVIMATAAGKKDDIMDCMKLGINGYLVKPIDHKTISAKIMEIYQKVFG